MPLAASAMAGSGGAVVAVVVVGGGGVVHGVSHRATTWTPPLPTTVWCVFVRGDMFLKAKPLPALGHISERERGQGGRGGSDIYMSNG